MAVMHGYLCERCPLAFEIGGGTYWELDGRLEQAVCRACGTMHRLTESKGACEVAALPGPVRALPLVTRTAEWYAGRYDQDFLQLLAENGVNINPAPGEEISDYEWPFTAADWESIGQHPGGIGNLRQFACVRCRAGGQMQSLEFPPHADGFWLSFREVCPMCSGPMPCLYVSTSH
jgi:hypothetical protein